MNPTTPDAPAPAGRRSADVPHSGPAAVRPIAGPPVGVRERRDRAMGWRSRDVARSAVIVFGILVLGRLLWFANSLVFVVFLGVLFGLAVAGAVDRLERFKVRRGIASALIVFGTLAGIIGHRRAHGAHAHRAVRRAAQADPDRGRPRRAVGGRAPEQPGLERACAAPSACSRRDARGPRPRRAGRAGRAAPRGTTAASPAAGAAPADSAAAASTARWRRRRRRRPRRAPPRSSAAAAAPTRGRARRRRPPTGSRRSSAASSPARRGSSSRSCRRSDGGRGLALIIFLAIYIGAEPKLYTTG
jgi:hypothetical protein